MQRLFLSLLVVAFLNFSFSQDYENLHHLLGFIANKYPITVNIFIYGSSVKGTMYYDKVGQYIYLTGTYDGNNMQLTGKTKNGQISDVFDGKFNKSGIYSGIWYNGSKSKSFNFTLREKNKKWVKTRHYKLLDRDSVPFGKEYVTFSFKFDADYPVAFPVPKAGQLIQRQLNKIIFDTNFVTLEKRKALLNRIKGLWKDDIKNAASTDDPYPYNYEYQIGTDMDYQGNAILAVEKYDYEYLGGAHPVYSTTFYNFDLITGKLLTFGDVFKISKDDFIKKFVKPNLDEVVQEYEQWYGKEVPLPDTYCFLADSVRFLYHMGTIAGYSEGELEFKISYKDLLPYMKPEIARRFKK